MEAEVSAVAPTPLDVVIINSADEIDRQQSKPVNGIAGAYSAGVADGIMVALRMMEAGKILGPLPPPAQNQQSTPAQNE